MRGPDKAALWVYGNVSFCEFQVLLWFLGFADTHESHEGNPKLHLIIRHGKRRHEQTARNTGAEGHRHLSMA